jgi:hypothetical protein
MITKTERRVLFLPDDTAEGIRALDVTPTRPFSPFALIVWGAKADTFVRQLRIGWETQLIRPMAGFEFESDVGWEQFRQGLCWQPRLETMPIVEKLRELGPFLRLSLPVVKVGQNIYRSCTEGTQPVFSTSLPN